MKALRNYLDKIKPNFEEGGKLHAFRSVFDGFETFLFVPNSTSKTGVHIHDAIDSKRIMSMVVIALIPALLFGMYNVGYQHFLAVGQEAGFFEKFIYGFLAVLPKIIVSYVVGLGIEFVVAQWKNEEIQEGFLVSGLLIPMIVPVECPLWILAVATAFSVIFAKEVFGGTGMNIFNPALITRAFLFFAYPTKMSGDAVWVSTDSIFGIGGGQVVDGFTGATMLGQAATAAPGASELINVNGTPATMWDMYNVGYQHFLAVGQEAGFFEKFIYGFLAVLPKIIVSYVVGLGIEFVVAQWKNEEIQEGFLVSGLLIPMIVPVECPLWILAVATAFSVIFAKEVFGGTGMNIFNPALITRAFLFFAYPTKMSGDAVWVSTDSIFGIGGGQVVDGFTGATMLGQAATAAPGASELINVNGTPATMWDMVVGLIPGSIGETSVIAIALGAIILLWTGVASWKTMFSVFAGGIVMGLIFNVFGSTDNMMAQLPWYEHIVLGGFCFGAVFMATDPVTSARTEKGKFIYGFLIGVMAIVIRVLNPGYPEGMMLAILLMNIFAPLIDYCIVQKNITARENRLKSTNN